MFLEKAMNRQKFKPKSDASLFAALASPDPKTRATAAHVLAARAHRRRDILLRKACGLF